MGASERIGVRPERSGIGSGRSGIRSEVGVDTFRSGGVIRSEPIHTLFRNTHRYVPNLSMTASERIDDYFRTYR